MRGTGTGPVASSHRSTGTGPVVAEQAEKQFVLAASHGSTGTGPVVAPFATFLVSLAAALLAALPAFALEPPANVAKVPIVLVVSDRIDLPDLLNAKAPALHALMRKGAVGLVSPKMAGQICSANAWATMWAGRPATNLKFGSELISTLELRAEQAVTWWNLQDLGITDGPGEPHQTILVPIGNPLQIVWNDRWIEQPPVSTVTDSQIARRIGILEAIARVARPQDAVYIFLVLTPRVPRRYFPRLTPIIVAGPRQAGLLTSATTRQKGLVALEDLAPTILTWRSVPVPPDMTGRPIRADPSADPVGWLRYLDDWARSRDAVAESSVVLMGVLQGLSGLLGLPLLLVRKRSLFLALFPWSSGLLLCGCALPLAALAISPVVTSGETFTLTGMTLLAVALGGGLALWRRDLAGALRVLCGLTAFVIMFDALRGGVWTTWSILGNSFTTGGRFYGVENGHAAYLISFLLIAVALRGYGHRSRQLPPGLWLTLAAILLPALIGLRWFGANFGGMVALGAGLWSLRAFVRSSQAGMREIAVALTLAALVAAAVVGLEVLIIPQDAASHVGIAFRRALFDDPSSLLDPAMRKWQANLRFLQVTPFNYALLAGALLLTVLCWKPVQAMQRLFENHRVLLPAFRAALVALWVAFFTNDSGIVMLDQMVQIVAPALVLLLLEERRRDVGLVPLSPFQSRT